MRLQAARMAVLALSLVMVTAWAAGPEPDMARIKPVSAGQFEQVLNAKRGQVVLVNFWATWCRSCLEEIPALMELADRFRERGFELVAVSLDEPDSLQSVVLPFMDKWFPAFSSFISTEREMDTMVSVVDPAWNEILPTSYVLDRDGSVVAKIQGGKTGQEFGAVIRPLLD